MSRYIDAECDCVTEVINRRAFNSREDVQDFLDNIPTADVVLVKHGHWHWSVECFHDVCSCCAHLSNDSNDLENYPYKFCPHCGAKMDGDVSNVGNN